MCKLVLIVTLLIFGHLENTLATGMISVDHSSDCLKVYSLSLSRCDHIIGDLNDREAGSYLCGLSDSMWNELLTFMIEVRDMEPSDAEWSRICSIISPIARVGLQAANQGLDEHLAAKTQEELHHARWRIASMHELLQFSF